MKAGFHREAISSTEGGFIPSTRTDLTEKSHSLLRMAQTEDKVPKGALFFCKKEENMV